MVVGGGGHAVYLCKNNGMYLILTPKPLTADSLHSHKDWDQDRANVAV